MAQDYDRPEKNPAEPADASDAERPTIAVPAITAPAIPGRRGVLMLGAAAASTVVTIRPALASTAASVLNCKIPIPDPAHTGQYIAQDGKLVPAGTQGAVRPPPRAVTGEEAKQMIQGQSPAGFDSSSREAYVNYIRRLQHGTSGFTCYASLQAPRP